MILPTQVENRNSLVEVYAYLVSPIARSIRRRLPPSFPIEDLVQTGFLGLLDAADRFGAYARVKIRGRILDSVRGDWPDSTCNPLPAGYLERPDRALNAEQLLIKVEIQRHMPDIRVLRRLKKRLAA